VLEFLNRVLGVTPTKPGFAAVTVAPHRCGLSRAAGTVQTPRGPIHVAWTAASGPELAIEIEAPAGVEVQVVGPGGGRHGFAGGRWKGVLS
jgi:hypothetical protein